MDSVNFSQLCTPTAGRTLNRTFSKSQTRNLFGKPSSHKQNEFFEMASSKLKNIGLTESVWETYQVNALYNFSYRRSKLYEYEEILAKNVKKAILESDIDEYNSAGIQIQFEKFPKTAVTKRDSPALKITIIAQDVSEEFIDEYVEVFHGILLSVGRKKGLKEKERLTEEVIILPLVLVEYENKIFLESFIDFLEENFSCIVNPLEFSSTDLKWMLTLFSSPDNENWTYSTVLEYEVPSEELKSIDYIINTESVRNVRNKIIKPSTEIVTEDDVNEFISVLESHFYKNFHINLCHLQLCAIRTPLGQVQRDHCKHSIKVYESRKLYFVMRHLTNLAQEIVS